MIQFNCVCVHTYLSLPDTAPFSVVSASIPPKSAAVPAQQYRPFHCTFDSIDEKVIFAVAIAMWPFNTSFSYSNHIQQCLPIRKYVNKGKQKRVDVV